MSGQSLHRKKIQTCLLRLTSFVINTDSSWLKFSKEETLNYLCCQFDGEGFHSFKVMAGGS